MKNVLQWNLIALQLGIFNCKLIDFSRKYEKTENKQSTIENIYIYFPLYVKKTSEKYWFFIMNSS